MSQFKFGRKSLKELEGVHPDLVAVVHRALQLTEQDFSVHDGLRTSAEQQALFKRGASQLDGYNKKSKHQEQSDGFGHAVDLVPYINGKLRWEWVPIYKISAAMQQAGKEIGVMLRWGGAWHYPLTMTEQLPEAFNQEYVALRRAQGKSAFIDGPHYELYD